MESDFNGLDLMARCRTMGCIVFRRLLVLKSKKS